MTSEQSSRPFTRRGFLAASAAVSVAQSVNAAAPLSLHPGLSLVGSKTAVLLIDLQKSNSALRFAPVAFEDVVSSGAMLANAIRSADGLVLHTRVLEREMADLPVDVSLPQGAYSIDDSDIVLGVPVEPYDVVISKRQWGAFYGTDLEQQLRRRHVETLVVVGVATEIGIESTVREAFDRGYSLVFASDAISGASADTHDVFMDHLFPRMGRVRTAKEIITGLSRA